MKKNTLNAIEMKARNKSQILNIIRQSNFSRADISRITGLTRATVTLIVDLCIKEGLIKEGEKNESPVGRKAISLYLNSNYGFCIGVNITRVYYVVALMDLAGNIVDETKHIFDDEDEPYEVLCSVSQIIDKYIQKGEGAFLGIGITTPGPVDKPNGKLLTITDFKKWNDFKIVEFFSNRYKCNIRWENISTAMAIAEYSFNDKLKSKNYIEILVENGIGSGIMLYENGRHIILENELGHTTIDYKGKRCGCGNVGCIERYASIKEIVDYAKAINQKFTSWQKIVNFSEDGDKYAVEIMAKEAEYLAMLAVTCFNAYYIYDIVFTGDIVYKFDIFIKYLKQAISKLSANKKINVMQSKIKSMHIWPAGNLIINSFILNEIGKEV